MVECDEHCPRRDFEDAGDVADAADGGDALPGFPVVDSGGGHAGLVGEADPAESQLGPPGSEQVCEFCGGWLVHRAFLNPLLPSVNAP